MLDRTFTPGFRSRLHLKDARIVLDTAERVGSAVPAFEVAADALRRLVEGGGGELDHSALFTLLEQDPEHG
jgi:2-hydroxy-3-oxopropionate reductase